MTIKRYWKELNKMYGVALVIPSDLGYDEEANVTDDSTIELARVRMDMQIEYNKNNAGK